MISIPTALSGARDVSGGSAAHKGVHAKFSLDSLFAADATSGSFASLFGQQTAALATSTQTSAASASANADIITQLTAQLQSGTPLATIVDQIAQSIGNAAAKQLQGTYTQSDVDRLRTSITQTIARALSPPSNAPPGTAAQEAATLAARLQQLVESLARDAQNAAGQQNELSGNLLDAVTAKEIPAQQKSTNGTQSTNTPRVSQVVRSLISSALSAVRASTPAAQSVAASATVAPVPVPQVSTPAPPAAAAPPSSGAAAVPSGSIGMSNAPDLLARMLVRAAGADTSDNTGAANASAAVNQSATSSAAPPSPSLLASRFAALLAQDADSVAAASSSNASGQNGASTANDSESHTFAQTPSPAPASGNALFSNAVAPATSMAAQLHDAIATTSTSASPVDANAVIEQLVKGITMRTDQQGTSEIRLQLQPENLGAVTMKLTVSGSQVSANVVAQSADVRNTIVANHQELARSLSDAGLTLSGFSVDVSGGDAGNDQNKDRTDGFGRRFTVHEVNGAASTDTADDSSSGPQLLGSSSLELFNYLA